MFYSPISSSSDSTIIIPLDRDENKFLKTTYTPSMTGGRATPEEVNQVLTLLDIIASNIPTPFQSINTLFIRFLVPAVMIWFLSETWE